MSDRENIAHKNKKMTLIYNSHDIEDKLTYAELKRIHEFGFRLKGFDVSARNIPKSATERLVHQLKGKSKKEIINVDALDRVPRSQKEMVNMIAEDSTLLKTPLVIRNGKVEQVDTSFDYIYEEIKINHTPVNVEEEDDPKTKGFVNAFGEIIIRHIAVVLLVLALTFGLAYHVINVNTSTSDNAEITYDKIDLTAKPTY